VREGVSELNITVELRSWRSQCVSSGAVSRR
jgi:hypothetical protein